MPPVLYPPSRPQSIAEVLDSAFRIFTVSLLKVLPYSVAATVVGQLPNIYEIMTGGKPHGFGQGGPVWWLLYLIATIIGFAIFNVILLRQVQAASGAVSAKYDAFLAAARRVPPCIGLWVLMLLCLGGCFLPLVLVPAPYRGWTAVLLCIPAIYLLVQFFCAWPALMIGQKGPFASLRYSVLLVRGNWWRSLMVVLVMVIMIIVLSATSGLIVGLLVQIFAAQDLAVTTAVSRVMVVVSGAVYIPICSAMDLSLYGDLQTRREGTDLERRIASAATG